MKLEEHVFFVANTSHAHFLGRIPSLLWNRCIYFLRSSMHFIIFLLVLEEFVVERTVCLRWWREYRDMALEGVYRAGMFCFEALRLQEVGGEEEEEGRERG